MLFYPAAFIALEGLDAAGKSTQVAALEKHLVLTDKKHVITVADPGTTTVAKKVREILFHPDNKEHMSPATELLLFAAARASLVDHIRSEIKKNPKTVVISDRFIHSTLAYQQMGRGIDHLRVRKAIDVACYGLYPTLTIYLDVSEETIKSRLMTRSKGEGNHFDDAGADFRKRVRAGYEASISSAFAMYGDVARVDANMPMQAVHASICSIVDRHLADREEDHDNYVEAQQTKLENGEL